MPGSVSQVFRYGAVCRRRSTVIQLGDMNSVVGVVLARESLPGIAPVRGGMYDQSMAYIHGDVMVGASIQPLIEHHVSSLQLGRFDFCPVGGEP